MKKYIDAVTPRARIEYIRPSKAYVKKKGLRKVKTAASTPVFLPKRYAPILYVKKTAPKKKIKDKSRIQVSPVPNILKTTHSKMFQSGGEVSAIKILIISGKDFIERIAEKPSSPQRL